MASTGFTLDVLATRVVFGPGVSSTQLAAELERLALHRILLICTPQEEQLARKLVQPLGDEVVATLTDVQPHVPADVVQQAAELLQSCAADGLLSIGGGSTTGTAKALALGSSLPIVAVPTTYAGSEVTPIWGMTEHGRKTTGRSELVLPKTVLYDPDLTVTLPADLTAASAMNAMAHCVEAFYGPGANPVTDVTAAEGVRALAAGLPPVMADLSDTAGRSDLLYGAHLAGAAFATAGSGLHHKICHVLGGAFDLPHAETHTVVLPHVAAFNEPAVPALQLRVAPALGAATVSAGLVDLIARIGAPTALADLGMAANDLDRAVELVLEKDLSDNPRPVDADDIRRLLTAAFYGKAPEAA